MAPLACQIRHCAMIRGALHDLAAACSRDATALIGSRGQSSIVWTTIAVGDLVWSDVALAQRKAC
jgi:hypothetical protein